MNKSDNIVAWRSNGIRWDGVEQFIIKFEDGHTESRWEHISYHLPYTTFKDIPYDKTLKW